MSVVLVRYCEIGLKSAPVRRRFEYMLRENMLGMLAQDRIEAIVDLSDARYFIRTDDIASCVDSVKKVFGIASLSVAEECTSDMREICEMVAEYSMDRISAGESFAVKARREGTHAYTSMDIGREAGSAILLANADKGVRVDLSHPDRTFYIEVRDNRAFYFDQYVRCPGGLPLGTQGKVIAAVNDDRGVVSAWMMMKRGCRVCVRGDHGLDILRMYDPKLRVLSSADAGSCCAGDVIGYVSGRSVRNFVPEGIIGVPTYHPTIGMTDREVSELLESIRTSSFRRRVRPFFYYEDNPVSGMMRMGRPPKSKIQTESDTSRWKILSAAAELFVEHGYENVSVKQIMEKADVLNGTLYYFFNGKEEILEAIFVEQLNRTLDDLVEHSKKTDDEMTLFLYSVAILLCVTKRSKKIADLYYHAHSSRRIIEVYLGMLMELVYSHFPDYEEVLPPDKLASKYVIVLGAMRTYFGMFAYYDLDFGYRDALRTVAKIYAVLFDIHVFNIDELITEICGRVEANSITFGICGYELAIGDRSPSQ